MREPRNNTEELILMIDDHVSRLIMDQDACESDEKWRFFQSYLNLLNERRAELINRYINEISDEFISSPNCRD